MTDIVTEQHLVDRNRDHPTRVARCIEGRA